MTLMFPNGENNLRDWRNSGKNKPLSNIIQIIKYEFKINIDDKKSQFKIY